VADGDEEEKGDGDGDKSLVCDVNVLSSMYERCQCCAIQSSQAETGLTDRSVLFIHVSCSSRHVLRVAFCEGCSDIGVVCLPCQSFLITYAAYPSSH
jgi:hypothetical protein